MVAVSKMNVFETMLLCIIVPRIPCCVLVSRADQSLRKLNRVILARHCYDFSSTDNYVSTGGIYDTAWTEQVRSHGRIRRPTCLTTVSTCPIFHRTSLAPT